VPQAPVPADAKVTAARASDVELMLGNARTGGALTQSTLVSVITKYGGGYVLSASATGTAGTSDSTLKLDVVLGPGRVQSTVQGETVLGPAVMKCYEFTATFLNPAAGYREIGCPDHSDQDDAARLAAQQSVVQQAALGYGYHGQQAAAKALPQTVQQAEQLLGVDAEGLYPTTPLPTPMPSPAPSLRPLAAYTFAASANVAALAVPQPGDGCVFVRFAPEPAYELHPGTIDIAAWAAPVGAACTGPGALQTAGYMTVDANAGG
jgi:hypothetical protein